MAERRFGSVLSSKTEDGGSGPVEESRPAIKSSAVVDRAFNNSRATSGPMSPDLEPAVRPSASVPRIRTKHRAGSDPVAYQQFRRACDELLVEAKRADDFLVDGGLSDEGMEVVVEVEQLLDKLYKVDWGHHECLKRIVVAIGSQIYNVRWTPVHVGFLGDIVRLLRNSYLVDDSLVRECLKLIKDHGLDVFRGTVAETDVRRKFRIIEMD